VSIEPTANRAKRSEGWNKNVPRQLSPLDAANQGGQVTDKKQDFMDEKLQKLEDDGIDRRGFLKCMAWAGTGLVWTMSGGIPVSRAFAKSMDRHGHKGEFSFVQISDSHMGFNKPANPDVVATLQAAVDKINGLAQPPEFLLHTGDISHMGCKCGVAGDDWSTAVSRISEHQGD
jgi:hypothetical protein